MVSVFVFVFVVASALGVSMGGAARLISIAAVAQALFASSFMVGEGEGEPRTRNWWATHKISKIMKK